MKEDDLIRKEEFKSDLSSYLNKKSKSSSRFINLSDIMKDSSGYKTDVVILKEKSQIELFLDWVMSPFKSNKKIIDDEIEGEDVTEELDDFEEKILDEPDDEEMEFEDQKENSSFLARLFNFFLKSDKQEIVEDVDESDEEKFDENKEDLRRLALFTKEVLKRLSQEDFNNLKNEGKINEFKELLKKNNLIKQ